MTNSNKKAKFDRDQMVEILGVFKKATAVGMTPEFIESFKEEAGYDLSKMELVDLKVEVDIKKSNLRFFSRKIRLLEIFGEKGSGGQVPSQEDVIKKLENAIMEMPEGATEHTFDPPPFSTFSHNLNGVVLREIEGESVPVRETLFTDTLKGFHGLRSNDLSG